MSRQLSVETATLLYTKTVFQFRTSGTLRHFLDGSRPSTEQHIRNVSPTHREYGHPRRLEHAKWRVKCERLWELLCWRLVDDCNIENLELNLHYHGSYLKFSSTFSEMVVSDPKTDWVKALWAFQDVGIRRCWGRLQCDTIKDTVLEVESWKRIHFTYRQSLFGIATSPLSQNQVFQHTPHCVNLFLSNILYPGLFAFASALKLRAQQYFSDRIASQFLCK